MTVIAKYHGLGIAKCFSYGHALVLFVGYAAMMNAKAMVVVKSNRINTYGQTSSEFPILPTSILIDEIKLDTQAGEGFRRD